MIQARTTEMVEEPVRPLAEERSTQMLQARSIELVQARSTAIDSTTIPITESRATGMVQAPRTIDFVQPRPPAIDTPDRNFIGGGGDTSGMALVDLPSVPPLPSIGLPSSGFERLQEAVNAARGPDGTPLTASQKKTIYDTYGLASEGLSDAGADRVADQLAILVKNAKMVNGKEYSGHIYTPDASGKTVFDHLEQLLRGPLAPEFAAVGKPELTRQLVERLAAPEAVQQGTDTLDCTLATLEAELAFLRPSDFTRMAVGLITRGSAPLADGSVMPAAKLDPANQAGRNDLDFAMQSALGALATGRDSWDSATPIDAAASERLHEQTMGGDWTTLDTNQVFTFLMGLAFNPDAGTILKDMRNDVGGLPKLTMRFDDGSLHSMVLVEAHWDRVGLWDPIGGKVTHMSPFDFANQFVRATAPAKWLGTGVGSTQTNVEAGEGGRTSRASTKTLA